jgi:demethylmenaquinone methyltransferase/2-methoxy-6-polyprenyl-1,4-benzoquinol methylase
MREEDPMALSNPVWLNDDERRRQMDPSAAEREDAFFGFQRIRAREKTARVVKHFDSVAAVYDGMNSLLSFGIHHTWKRASVRLLALRPGERVLDVCGGTGDLAILAARRVGGRGRVIIYDINRAMLAAGMHKVVGRPLEACIRHVQGDAERIAFPDDSFDAAMVGFGIRNVTRMRQGLAEMHRVLRPGGRLLCLEFSRPVWPVFRWLYDMYSFHLMPLAGELIAGSRTAYTHLPESIRMFPLPHELADMLREVGFGRVDYRRFTNGIAVAHLAVKDNRP